MTKKSGPTPNNGESSNGNLARTVASLRSQLEVSQPIRALAEKMAKQQETFRKIAETSSLDMSKLRHPSLDLSQFTSVFKNIEQLNNYDIFSESAKNLKLFADNYKIVFAQNIVGEIALAATKSMHKFQSSIKDILAENFPENWKGYSLSLSEATLFGQNEALTTVYVPSSRILKSFSRSNSANARRKILYNNRHGIIKSCIKLLEDNQPENAMCEYLEYSIKSWMKGDYQAAQGLATNTLETLITDLELVKNNQGQGVRKVFKNEVNNDESMLSIAAFVIAHSILGVYKDWRKSNGDPQPEHFNRHASAHHVGKVQYTLVNSMQAIMLGTALLVSIHRGEL